MKNNDKIWAFVVALYIFLALRPVFTWSLPENFMMYLQIIPTAIIAIRLELKKKGNLAYFLAFCALFLFVCLLRGYNMAFTVRNLSLAIIPFVKKRFVVKSIDYFRKLYAMVIGFSLIMFLLLSLGVPIHGQVIPPLNTFKDYNYISYPLLVIPTKTEFMIRFHGPFDEPGVIGTIGLILLVINKFNLKDFWNIIIFISCIWAFSFAFFGGTIVYLLIRLIVDRSKSLLYLVLGIGLFYAVTSKIPVFRDTIYSRMEYDEERGKFAGDSRTTIQMDDYFETLRFTPVYWWGTSNEDIISVMLGGSSYKIAILRYGLVFIVLYCVLIWAFAVHYKLKLSQLLIFIGLMLVNLYQRPNLLSFTYIYLYMSYVKLRAYENEDLLLQKLPRKLF
jgi:hypothetical protein